MSQFFTERYSNLTPYTPGEQPQDKKYIKLNTNESPFPPSPAVLEAAKEAAGTLQLYSDPECKVLRAEMSRVLGVPENWILMTNGSDEGLNFAFMAFADEKHPLLFPNITYGFYPVFAQLNHIPYTEVPLKADFSIDPADYCGKNATVVIANPNAPTGMALSLNAIEKIVQSNPESVVIIDEAYVDFGGTTAIGLTAKYENLLVVGTFSKSRSMAGARLGFCIGNPGLINDLNTMKYSTNPYNINRMTAACGAAALRDNDYYMANCRTVMENRAWTAGQLQALGFTVLPSQANFLFARSERISGMDVYTKLKEKGVLVRHFTKPLIDDYVRITIGSKEQMETLICALDTILKEENL